MNIDHFFHAYAWEELNTPKEFKGKVSCTDIHVIFGIENNIQILRVYRDDNYDIQIKAEGEMPGSAMNYSSTEKATRLPMTNGTIVCDSYSDGIISFQNCISEPPTLSNKYNNYAKFEFSTPFRAEKVNWKRRLDGAEMDTLIEWYLNGIQESSVFGDRSYIRDEVSRIITRADKKVHEIRNVMEYGDDDCIYISFNGTGVLMRRVYHKHGMCWNCSLALEYRSDYGRIPEKEERKKIAELLGFLLGRHLILVGDTAYCNDVIIESNMYKPHSQNAVAECNSVTKEIVPVHHCKTDSKNFKLFVEKLLPRYLEIRDEYGLDSVLSRYWLANIMPPGVNLPVLAGALESMMKPWFKGERSKTKGVYIDAVSYGEIIKDFLSQLREKMENSKYREKVLNKISSAYQIGVNDRYFIFLEELGLEYGESEKDCIKARNAFTHGDKKIDDFETLQKTRTMFILLGRVILKILGYEGQYIDETLKGEKYQEFVCKGINDRIG